MIIFFLLTCSSSGRYSGNRFDKKPRNDFQDITDTGFSRFDLGRSRSFEDSPEQRLINFIHL